MSGDYLPHRYCLLRQTVAQGIGHNVYSPTMPPLDFQTAEGSAAHWWDPGQPQRITVDRDGYYLTVANAVLVGVPSSEYDGIYQLYKNNDETDGSGGYFSQRWRYYGEFAVSAIAPIRLTAGDWIHFSLYQSTGATRNTDPDRTTLALIQVATL